MVVQKALQNFARCPYIVGTHWFQYYDEPKGGRPDGEDYNMGLVDIYDRPYQEVLASFQGTNPLLSGFHAQANLSWLPRGRADCHDSSGHRYNRRDRCFIDRLGQRPNSMPGFVAEPPNVPFADIYLTWDPNGLYLATIGMDYMNPADRLRTKRLSFI